VRVYSCNAITSHAPSSGPHIDPAPPTTAMSAMAVDSERSELELGSTNSTTITW
jgi:hypothetical protein